MSYLIGFSHITPLSIGIIISAMSLSMVALIAVKLMIKCYKINALLKKSNEKNKNG